MDISNSDGEPGGPELIQKVASLTGLPEAWAEEELDDILVRFGDDPNSDALTLDHLRKAMAAYLEALHSEIQSQELNSTAVSE